jgi:nucleotide-binding universal stress UspA family protein
MGTEVSFMSESLGFFMAVAAGWLAIGLVLSIVMGRRGHDSFGWLVLGTLLGPLAVVMAVDAGRNDERLQPASVAGRAAATAGGGPVDVLVGSDGSPESAAAMNAAVDLLGDRLGRLTVATVVPYGGVREPERHATETLRLFAGPDARRVPDLEVLHGHPSEALRQPATEGGYELIVVGTRGKGFTNRILGSAASELARDSKIPVLLVGGR